MGNDFKRLFEPGRIGKMELPNRIVMAPMGLGYAHLDGRFSQRHIDYFAARARGGVGLIITELTKVERTIEPPLDLPLAMADSDRFVPAMTDLVDAVHDYGTKIAIQLTAGLGRQLDLRIIDKPPVSASEVPAFQDPSIISRAMSIDEIQTMVEAFGKAAERAQMAGFDMIELHGHVGFLIDQFMSPIWNKRKDQYGGDFEGRMRFAVEIVESIRKNVGPDMALSFRLSVEHGIPGGRTTEESKAVAQRLEAAGVDVIHANMGCYDIVDHIFPTSYMGDACLSRAAASIKEAVNIPVIAVGNITPEAGEELLASGKADFVAYGRGLIADPDWPRKVKRGRIKDVRPCIRCNELCIGRTFTLGPMACSVNVLAGKERYYEINKVEKPKQILVIGGGPAGMEAARIARLRGHDVTLYEKDNVLGGQLCAAGRLPFKKELHELIKWQSGQLKKTGVEVILNRSVVPEIVKSTRPDAVIIATGAKPVMPPIPGIDSEKVVGVMDYHMAEEIVSGDEIVVVGGGLAGCEAALGLAMVGKKVTLLEALSDVALDVNIVNRMSLLRFLAEQEVTILTEHTVREIGEDALMAKDSEGKEVRVPADNVIIAVGMRSDNDLVKQLEDLTDELYVTGDCVNPSKVGDAIHSGFVAGWRV